MIFPTLLAAVALLPSASATYYATSPPTSAPTSGSLNSCYKQKHCMHATMTKSSPSKCSGCGCEYTVCLTVDPTKHSCTDNKVDRFCYGKSHICQNSVWDWNDYRWEFPGHSGPTQKSLSFSHSKTKCQTGRPGERLAFLVGDGDNCYGTDHLAIPGKGVHLSCSQYYYGRYPSNDDCGGTRWKQCAWEITLPLTCGSTPHPTANPTPQPTANPTPQPTANPTPQPTANPTPCPTANPTPQPTANPTPQPTANPTPQPTANPTPQPTANPTPHPTANPTPLPTANPTQNPIGDNLCRDGITNHDGCVCCPAGCKSCGGCGCASDPLGADKCCPHRILENEMYCTEDGDTACILGVCTHVDGNCPTL